MAKKTEFVEFVEFIGFIEFVEFVGFVGFVGLETQHRTLPRLLHGAEQEEEFAMTLFAMTICWVH